MARLSVISAVMVTLLTLASGVGAAVLNYTPHRSVYGTVLADSMAVTDIAIDNANRTWYTTNRGGFVSFSGVVPNLPAVVGDLFSPSLSSIAFADAAVSGAIQESFFIGSNNDNPVQGDRAGAQYGRVLEGSRVSFGADLCTGPPSYEGEITCALLAAHGSEPAVGVVNDLTVDLSGNKMWVATERGVTSIDLSDSSLPVSSDIFDAGFNISPFAQARKVIAADPAVSGAEAFFIAQGALHMIVGTASRTFDALDAFVKVGAITLDGAGNLWVAEFNTIDAEQLIFRYPAADLLAWDGTPINEPVLAPENIFSFNPQDQNGSSEYFEVRQINELSVNSGTSELWVATTKGAFFQEFDSASPVLNPKLCSQGLFWADSEDDLDGSIPPAPCIGDGGGWHPLPQREIDVNIGGSATKENFGAVLADSSANVWLGSSCVNSDPNCGANSGGFRSVIARLLTLSGTRFIGVGARVGITLTDITVVDGDPVTVSVTVGGETADITLTASGVDTYTGSFGFTFGIEPSVAPSYLFPVTPTAAGVPITVTYSFNNDTQELIATASWAEIIPFEDDLLIGGPCMIRAMER